MLLLAASFAACGDDDQPDEGAGPTGSTAAESPTGSDGERISVPGAGEALVWGEGRRTVVLAHGAATDAASWTDEAADFTAEGNYVLALEQTDPESILAAVDYLRAEQSAESVTLIGASAGADSSLDALSMRPDAVDQLITLSVNSTEEGLGTEPKLFIASEDEPVAELSTSSRTVPRATTTRR